MQPLEKFDLSACKDQRFLNWGKRNPKKKNQNKKTLAILLRQELPLGKSYTWSYPCVFVLV